MTWIKAHKKENWMIKYVTKCSSPLGPQKYKLNNIELPFLHLTGKVCKWYDKYWWKCGWIVMNGRWEYKLYSNCGNYLACAVSTRNPFAEYISQGILIQVQKGSHIRMSNYNVFVTLVHWRSNVSTNRRMELWAMHFLQCFTELETTCGIYIQQYG